MSIKFSARNSKAGNGCTNFMGAWDFVVLSAGEACMPIKVLAFGGRGGYFGFAGGVPITFLWARGFF